MTNQQGAPEALRLADIADDEAWAFVIGVRKEIATELRRLHAENERLAALVEAQQPAPSAAAAVGQEPALWMNEKGHTWSHSDWKQFPKHRAKYPIPLYAHWPSPQPSPTPQADSVTAPAGGAPMSAAGERRLFKEQFRHLELDEVPDAWGRPQFKHSHVDAIWHGWRQRAAIALLDTPPAQAADSVLEDAARLAKITQAIRDYHFALDCREHGGVAMARAWNAICDVLNMDWVQGAESAARKQGANHD